MLTKSSLYFLLLLVFSMSCEDDAEPPRTLAADLQTIIAQQRVTALSVCCVGCSCESQGSGDYSFPGDNVLRITTTYYNLDQMLYSSIRETENDKLMILYFPQQ